MLYVFVLCNLYEIKISVVVFVYDITNTLSPLIRKKVMALKGFEEVTIEDVYIMFIIKRL